MLTDYICNFSVCFQRDFPTPKVLKPHLNVANESFLIHLVQHSVGYNVWANGFLHSQKSHPGMCLLFPSRLIFLFTQFHLSAAFIFSESFVFQVSPYVLPLLNFGSFLLPLYLFVMVISNQLFCLYLRMYIFYFCSCLLYSYLITAIAFQNYLKTWWGVLAYFWTLFFSS